MAKMRIIENGVKKIVDLPDGGATVDFDAGEVRRLEILDRLVILDKSINRAQEEIFKKLEIKPHASLQAVIDEKTKLREELASLS